MSDEEKIKETVSPNSLKKVNRMPEILNTDKMAPMSKAPVPADSSKDQLNKMPEWKTD